MGTATRRKADRSAWREYRRRLLPVAIFGIFLILAYFSFVALVVNGQLGIFATLLLFAYTYTVPKATVPLRNKAYVEELVSSLKREELEGAIFSMGYLPNPIKRCFAERQLDGFSLEYVVEGRTLGTAGAIKYAEDLLRGRRHPTSDQELALP